MTEIRTLKDGDWYWIDKEVILKRVPEIRAMGVTVYNFLAAMADKNQCCFPSQKYMADRLGYSRTAINKAIKVLEKYGLVARVKRNRYHCEYLLLRCKPEETQVSIIGNRGVRIMNTNNNDITRYINNSISKFNKFSESNNSFKGLKPKTTEYFLAVDIAEALHDPQGLPLYLSYAKKYPENLLRRVLGEVKEVPVEKIKKTRGALFNHLIQKKYGENNHCD